MTKVNLNSSGCIYFFKRNNYANVYYISLVATTIIVGLACIGFCLHQTILDPYCTGDYYKRFVIGSLGMGGVCSLALAVFLIPKMMQKKISTS